MDDTPISELIPVGSPNLVTETPLPKKQNKPFIIIISILLVLAVCAGGYYVYTQYFANEEEEEQEEEQEQEDEFSGIEIVLKDNSKVYVKAENSECDDTGFVKVENLEYLIWEDNQNNFCSSSYIFSYFPSKEVMSKYYASTQEVPTLQKITVAGTEYEYVKKVDGIKEQEGVGMGIAYKWEPEITVKEYKANSLISYYNYDISSDLKKDSTVTTYCLFDLSKLFEGVEGYLVFSGVADGYSGVDYCSLLNEMETFSITK